MWRLSECLRGRTCEVNKGHFIRPVVIQCFIRWTIYIYIYIYIYILYIYIYPTYTYTYIYNIYVCICMYIHIYISHKVSHPQNIFQICDLTRKFYQHIEPWVCLSVKEKKPRLIVCYCINNARCCFEYKKDEILSSHFFSIRVSIDWWNHLPNFPSARITLL